MNHSKEHYTTLVSNRVRYFKQIAEVLGKEHPITKMMGSLAWGRYDAEWGPGHSLRDVVEAFGFLNGSFSILNMWARDNDQPAQTIMLSIWKSGYFIPKDAS